MKNNFFDLKGKTSIVTGGGRGIGRSIAIALAKSGSDVAVADIDLNNSSNVSKEIIKLDKRSIGLKIDVTKKEDTEKLIYDVVKEFEKVDVMINCAGVPGSRLPSSELIEEKDVRKFIDIMLVGTFFCCQEAGKQMIKQKKGKIINISSVSGIIVNRGLSGLAPYCGVKAGVIQMSRALASDWAKYNINVNCISPGYVRTPATEGVLADPARYKLYVDTVPLNRIATPDDIIGAAIFLSSDESDYITGQNIIIDGGITVW